MLSRRNFYLFILPWLIGFVALTAVPLVVTIYTSFTRWSGTGGATFIGLGNYRDLIHDSVFVQACLKTIYFAAGSVGLTVLVAFVLAVLLAEGFRGYKVYRALLFIPYVVTGIPLYIIWTWLYDPNFGVFNYLLGLVGISGPQWLQNSTWAMPALIFMSATACGGMMLVFVAALQNVPVELYESAEVDGAGPVARAWWITLPMIRPVVGFNVIWGLIGAVQVFAQPYAMTGGGPDYATEVVGLDLYQNGFTYYKFGYSSAMALFMFLATLLLSILVFRATRPADVQERARRLKPSRRPSGRKKPALHGTAGS
jgi:multiple sugar transport system permease protein